MSVSPKANRWVTRWLWVGIIMVLVQVAIGGITRLTDSGLSMTTWEPVKGALPPLSQEAWQESFDLYKASPEFIKRNNDFTLAEYKNIFWWEWIHRAWARLIGLVFIFPFFLFIARGWIERRLVWRLIAVMLLGAAQAFMGWYMVQSGLIDNPWVNPIRLTTHLFLALALFVLLLWLVLERNPRPPERLQPGPGQWTWLRIITIIALIQIFYGGLVAGTDAARFYHTWPTMDGQFIPDGIMKDKPVYMNFFDNVGMVQFIHRTIAILLVFSIAWFWRLTRSSWDLTVRKGATFLFGWVLVQFAMGVGTVLMSTALNIHLELGVAHQMGAFFLVGILVYLHYNISRHLKWEREKQDIDKPVFLEDVEA